MKRNLQQTIQSRGKTTLKPRIAFTTALLAAALGTFAQGNCLRDSSYTYNAQQEVSGKYYYSYDANGLISQTIRKDSVNGVWVNFSRTSQSWYSPGKYSETLEESWANNQWAASYRQSATYNAGGEVLTTTSESWDATSQSWKNAGFHQFYTYNALGQRIEQLQVYWSTGVPADSTRNTFTFDGNGNQVNTLKEAWTLQEPSWRPYQHWPVTFAANGLPDSTANLLYDTTSASWNLIASWRNTHDAMGNRTEEIVRNANNELSSRYSWSYDVNGNLLSDTYYWWVGSAWDLRNQTTRTYNSNNQPLSSNSIGYSGPVGQPSQLMNTYQYLWTYDDDGNLLETFGNIWNFNDSIWVFNYKEQNFFNCATAIDEISASANIQAFPNPTNGLLNLKGLSGEQLSIFNSQGTRVLKVRIGMDHETIDLTDLPNGIYVVKAENVSTQKNVKQ